MRRHKIFCLGILFFVVVRQGSFAQCDQTTQPSAVSTASNVLPTPKTAKPDSEDRTVVLQLEMTERGSVRDVEVLGNPSKFRAAAISAAVKFASAEKYLDRTTWPLITLIVRFPQNGHGSAKVGQAVIGGVPGCVFVSRVRVSAAAMGCYLLNRIEPVYPLGTQNTKDRLTFRVVIGKDGNVRKVEKLTGPEPLASAAVEAITKWNYRPYLLNGEPVEVETGVDLPAWDSLCDDVPSEALFSSSAPPFWLFNIRPVIPVLAARGNAK